MTHQETSQHTPNAQERPLTLEPDANPTDAFGVYVHVPFCERRCPYCDFSIALRKQIPHQAYQDALLCQLQAQAPQWDARPQNHNRLWSVYFGGGTPSLWSASCLGAVLRWIKTRWGEPQEVTVEVNPGGPTTPKTLDTWREAGVDRLSLGVQSFDPQALTLLGRTHSPDDVFTLLDQAQAAGFTRVSVDLIVGRANQTPEDVERDVGLALSHPLVEQVSAYALTIEPRTPYARQESRGAKRAADEDAVVAMMDTLDAALERRGLLRYEPSNSARPGRWSRHNVLYWRGCEYLGLGMGAHSMMRLEGGGALRRAATRDLKKYLADPVGSEGFREVLTAKVHLAERIFLALRTRFLFDLERLLAAYDLSPAARAPLDSALARLEAAGLLRRGTENGWFTTARGLRYHDEIAAQVLEALDG